MGKELAAALSPLLKAAGLLRSVVGLQYTQKSLLHSLVQRVGLDGLLLSGKEIHTEKGS